MVSKMLKFHMLNKKIPYIPEIQNSLLKISGIIRMDDLINLESLFFKFPDLLIDFPLFPEQRSLIAAARGQDDHLYGQ